MTPQTCAGLSKVTITFLTIFLFHAMQAKRGGGLQVFLNPPGRSTRMRTQFLYVGLLSMTLAGGLVSAGCSDIHTGQPSDPGGPVKLVRVMVQDDDIAGQGGVGSAIDLLDRPGTPLSVAVECNPDSKPCNVQYLVNGSGSFTCEPEDAVTGWEHSKTGFRCTDPLNPINPDGSAKPIPLQPSTGGPGAISGTEIRLVFNKVLNSSELEDIAA